MEEQDSLTRRIIHYRRTGAGLPEILCRAALIAYWYPKRKLRWSDDDSSDFFSQFYPKIRRLVERFEYKGKPFEAYLVATMRWQLKSFARQRALDRAKRKVIEREQIAQLTEIPPEAKAWPEAVRESCAYAAASSRAPEKRLVGGIRIGEDGKVVSRVHRRRIIILAMKGIVLLNSDDLARLARMTGCDLAWIHRCRDELWKRLEAKRERLNELRRRLNTAYFRVNYLHERLAGGPEGMDREHLLSMITFEQQSLGRTQDKLARLSVCPTHHDISEVLGIPKGSVDSSLFYFRNALLECDSGAVTRKGNMIEGAITRIGLN